jgi:ABC-type molybdate transport system substrate-binding protein
MRLLVFHMPGTRCGAGEITVFAAASLNESPTEIGVTFEKSSGDKVTFKFAASNTLARQIEAGAPADLTPQAFEELALSIGCRVTVVIKAPKIHLVAR